MQLHYMHCQSGFSSSERSLWERQVCSWSLNIEFARTNRGTRPTTICGLSLKGYKLYGCSRYAFMKKHNEISSEQYYYGILYYTILYTVPSHTTMLYSDTWRTDTITRITLTWLTEYTIPTRDGWRNNLSYPRVSAPQTPRWGAWPPPRPPAPRGRAGGRGRAVAGADLRIV